MNGWTVGALLVIMLWVLVLLAFARPLRARWREPVFRHPALVVESDDWGAGPLAQTEALRKIASVLQSFRDSTGRSPVMTLGIVFEVPDTERLARDGLTSYRGRGLDDACFEQLWRAIQSGVASGVFAPQLHGQCHYWPSALMTAAQSDADVRAWLTGVPFAPTEDLPSHLQTRWIDASQLPSRALDPSQIAAAAEEEAASYKKLLGESPRVAVPTTFVWNGEVERAWKKAGVEVVITPGRRATSRDAAGRLAGVDRMMLAGDPSDAGQCYLVRDIYCEPALGHSAQRLVDGLVERTRQGRACLVEMHRFNFLRQTDQSVKTLQTAMALSLDRYPNLRFATPLELARAIRQANPALLETRFAMRLRAWLARLHEVPRFGRATRLTGLFVPLRLLERALFRRPPDGKKTIPAHAAMSDRAR
jgi:hypothetical protein